MAAGRRWWWALLALYGEAVRQSPSGNTREGSWKEDVIRGAPSGDRLISRFRECQISFVQVGGPPRMWGPSHIPALQEDDRSKTRFLHVFKNAGTTIAHAVEDRGGSIRHWGPAYSRSIMEGSAQPLDALFADPEWLRVAFVRPPLERVLSAFHEEMMRAQVAKDHSGATIPSARADVLAMFVQLVDEMNFTQPAQEKNHKSGIIVDGIHFLTQTNFMIDQYGNKHPIDYIGDMADLADEMSYLLQDPELSLEYNSGPGEEGYGFVPMVKRNKIFLRAEDLPAKTLRTLCRVYRDDFCCFGYEIPDACDITC